MEGPPEQFYKNAQDIVNQTVRSTRPTASLLLCPLCPRNFDTAQQMLAHLWYDPSQENLVRCALPQGVLS